MGLAPGVLLAPVEINSPLGAVGLGKVCRARCTRPEREAAMSVLSTTTFCTFVREFWPLGMRAEWDSDAVIHRCN